MDTPIAYAAAKARGTVTVEKDADDADKICFTVTKFCPDTGQKLAPTRSTISYKELERQRDWNAAENKRIDALLADFNVAPTKAKP